MKKLIAIVLILALLLPAAAMADEKDVVGCWAHYELQRSGTPSMIMLYLNEYHICYFMIQSFDAYEAGIGRTFVGTWQLNDNGTVTAKTGNNTETTLYIHDTYSVAMDVRTADMYVNLTKIGIE